MPRTVLVFSGGSPLTPGQRAALPDAELVVAADSGVDRALACGRRIDVAIGDFDSVTSAGLSEVTAAGATILRHPVDKDQTDLELAMVEAMAAEPDRIVVTGLDGGRPDHFLAGVALLADRRFEGARVEARLDGGSLFVVHDQLSITGMVGEIVSLLPVGGDAGGVRTSGLRFPLDDETLTVCSPRGMSNELVTPAATVSLVRGTLLVIRPEA